MEKKLQLTALIKFWWIVPLAALVLVVLVARSQSGKIELPTILPDKVSETELMTHPSDPHSPVHIRLGVIKDIGVDYIVIESRKLVGQGNELITALITGETSIIEIQIPSYMNTELRKKLANGGNVIPRLEVTNDNLYVGQTVEVVSVADMYGYKEVSATRVEYKIIASTEEL